MKKIICSLVLIFCIRGLFSQGIANQWIVGYGSYWGAPFGHTIFDFSNGAPIISSDSLEMDFQRTAANISDTAGSLLFYTNGYYIADATGDTMQNGNNISPTGFRSIQPRGLTVPQACLALPKGNAGQYYLIHSTVDNAPQYNRALNLYYSVIDMSLNGGLGGVVSKNNVLLQDSINMGKITACKHANGRDWWVLVQQVNSNKYFKFLVLPTAILGPYTQNIGVTRTNNLGMACFSPDGKKYTYFHAEYQTNGALDIYDFDRCNGNLSNSIHITIPQCTGISGGVAFSNNSRFLYVANIETLYQFDMSAANIASSQLTVAVWDSFYSPSPPFATLFEIMQLAPDGKIYVTTGNGTFHMHVINYPDSAGLACDVQQHSIQFQSYYANGIPNHPNYFLGCDTSCTTCLVNTTHRPLSPERGIRAAPNPTSGAFTLQFNVQSISGTLEIYDVMGSLVRREYVAPWSQFKRVDIGDLARGIYMCKLRWKENIGSIKIVKE